MITKLKLAQLCRDLIAGDVVSALCDASRRARQALSPQYTHEAQQFEDWFDCEVRTLCADFGGDPDGLYLWQHTEYGKQQRIAVCDHIINELEQA